MKIGISCYPTYGGSGVIATELGKNLGRLGHEVHFISYALPYRLNEFSENIFYHEVKVPEYPLFEYPPYALSLATKIADIAIFEKLDILHVHYAIPHAISAVLARDMINGEHPLKIITTLHGTDITLVGADPSFTRITRYGINQSNAVTAVSEYLKEQTIKIFQPAKPIRVIPNFIEEHPQQQRKCEHLRKRLAPENEAIIMHLSNFRPVKRVQDIVDITKKVAETMPVRTVLIGDGPDRPMVEQRARELGVADKIVFMGKQENIYLLLSVADIFLMPSESESFGLAALEAMSCGIPCVTSNAGGLPEVNLHGKTGYLASVGAIEEMSYLVLRLLKDDELRKKMGRNAREHAAKNYHTSSIIPQYLKLYENLINS